MILNSKLYNKYITSKENEKKQQSLKKWACDKRGVTVFIYSFNKQWNKYRYLLHSHVFVITEHGSNDTAIQIKDTLTSAALVTHRRKSLLSTCDSCLGQSVCVCPTFCYTLFDSTLAFLKAVLMPTAIYVCTCERCSDTLCFSLLAPSLFFVFFPPCDLHEGDSPSYLCQIQRDLRPVGAKKSKLCESN